MAAPGVVPLACACWSRTAVPAALDSPAYSRTATPTSAAPVGVAVTVGRVPPVATTAVQTLSSVLSDAVKLSSLTKVSPALSVTVPVVADAELHTPTSTTSRLPGTGLPGRVAPRLATLLPCAVACWTNVGTAEAYADVTAYRLVAVRASATDDRTAVRGRIGMLLLGAGFGSAPTIASGTVRFQPATPAPARRPGCR